MKLQKNKSVAIKKKMSERIVLLALFLILSALFMFVLFMPFHRLVALDSTFDNLCYAIGGVGTVLFFIMSAYQFYHIAAKSTALIVTEEGIYDFVTGGKGVGFIDKGKITSIRIFGTVKKPILGIQVDNSKHLIRTAKKCVQDAVLYNLDMNMPAIVIYQKDLSCPVKEAASIIYEKINSAALSVEDVNKASTKVASETRAFTNEPKKDINKKETKRAEEAKQAEAARLAEEAKKAEAARLAEEAKQAEAARLAEEAKKAEVAKLAEEAKKAEAAKLAEEAKQAEAARLAEEAKQAEAARLAEEAKRAEAARLAEEAKRAEAARLAEEAKRAEAARLAEEAKKAEVAKPAEKGAGIVASEITEERAIPKYVFPPERFIKPGPQTEEDPSPEPYFEELRLDA